MADEVQAAAPEIDIDTLSDTEFTELKGKMRAEQPVDAPSEGKQDNQATDAAKTEKATPEANADDDAEPDGKAETVPHGQFHRERERRKAAELEKQQIAENYQKLLDRTTQLLQVQQPAQQQAEEPSLPGADDPMGRINYTFEQLMALNKRNEEQARAQQEAEQQRQVWQQTVTKVEAEYNQAVAADPTIPEAYNKLRESQGNELLAMGYSIPEAKIELDKLEQQHIAFAADRGLPIGTYIKSLAKARGWSPASIQQDNINTGKTEAEKIAEREATRLASQSLGKGGGAVVNTGVTSPQELLDMSDAEFEAYKKKHGSVAHAFKQAS